MKTFKFKDSYEMYYQTNGVDGDNDFIPVTVKQCFPKSHPTKYLSVQNKEGKEVLLIEDIDSLEEKSRKEILKFLGFKNFKMKILQINSIEDEFGLRRWDVETSQGPREFQVELTKWPMVYSDGTVLIEDISGDIYLLNTNESLDKKTKDLISDYIS